MNRNMVLSLSYPVVDLYDKVEADILQQGRD